MKVIDLKGIIADIQIVDLVINNSPSDILKFSDVLNLYGNCNVIQIAPTNWNSPAPDIPYLGMMIFKGDDTNE